jgi:hypothetical protein
LGSVRAAAQSDVRGAVQDDIVYLLYKLPTVVISRRTDQYSKAHEILTGVSAAATKRPRTAPMFPSSAASVPPPGTREMAIERPRLIHHYSAPEGTPALTASSSAPEASLKSAGLFEEKAHLSGL